MSGVSRKDTSTVLRSSPTPAGRGLLSTLQRSLVLLGCAAFSLTFSYHAIYGKHGLEAARRLAASSAELDRQIASLETVQAEYQLHIRLLGDRPHPDLVEEIARRDLGFAYPDEIVLRR